MDTYPFFIGARRICRRRIAIACSLFLEVLVARLAKVVGLVVGLFRVGLLFCLRSGQQFIRGLDEGISFSFEAIRLIPDFGLGFCRGVVRVGTEMAPGGIPLAHQFVGVLGELFRGVLIGAQHGAHGLEDL